MWGEWDHKSVCPSVCFPLITFEQIGRFLWNSVGRSCHWSDLDAILFNPVPSTIPKWRTFKLLRWMKNLNQSTWEHKFSVLVDLKRMNNFSWGHLCQKQKNTNMAASWMLQFIVCFVETTHEPLHLDKWTFVLQKIMDMPTSLILIIILFEAVFKYDDGAKFWGYVGKLNNVRKVGKLVLSRTSSFVMVIFSKPVTGASFGKTDGYIHSFLMKGDMSCYICSTHISYGIHNKPVKS
jgi:hypothetical protein